LQQSKKKFTGMTSLILSAIRLQLPKVGAALWSRDAHLSEEDQYHQSIFGSSDQ